MRLTALPAPPKTLAKIVAELDAERGRVELPARRVRAANPQIAKQVPEVTIAGIKRRPPSSKSTNT